MIVLDFETRSKCDLKKCGAYRYAEDPSTSVLCLAYAIKDLPVELWLPGEDMPKDLRYYIDYGFPVEAHNSGFERAIWRCIMVKQFGWPDIPDNQWRCSAARASALALPRSLEAVGAALGLPVQKSQDGKRVMMKLCQPRTPTKNDPAEWHMDREDFHTLYRYCRQDVEAERCLGKAIPQLTEKELAVWQLDQKINARGIRVDMASVKASLQIINLYTEKALVEFQALTGGTINSPTQRDKVLEWLKDEGVQITGLRKNDVIDALENKIGGLPSEKAQKVMRIRQALSKTSTAKYKALLDGVCSDGRLRDTLLYHGASTGRWTGKGIQPQNLPKNSGRVDLEKYFRILRFEDLEVYALCYPESMEALSSTIRGLFIPSEGSNFYGGDYSAIEARVLFWLAGEEKGLEMFRRNEDLYKDLASTIYNKHVSQVTPQERELGKRGILGAGYQMGPKKFVEAVKAFANLEISEELAKRVIEAYRMKYPAVPAMWNDQEAAMREAIETGKIIRSGQIVWFVNHKFLYATLPSGRRLAYYDPKIEPHQTPWGDTKPTVTYMAQNGYTKRWERDKTYGGKIVENCLDKNTNVLTIEGVKQLYDIKKGDLVWDGDNWVPTNGVVFRGIKKTGVLGGIRLTADHKILVGNSWKRAIEMDENYWRDALRPGLSSVASALSKVDQVTTAKLFYGVLAAMNVASIREHSSEERSSALNAGTKKQAFHRENMTTSCPHDCNLFGYIDIREWFRGAIIHPLKSIKTTVVEGLQSTLFGFQIAKHFWNTQKPYETGMLQGLTLTDEIMIRGISQGISDYAKDERIVGINEIRSGLALETRNGNLSTLEKNFAHFIKATTLSYTIYKTERLRKKLWRSTGRRQEVFDLLDCGPNNRFTVISAEGPVIVHNCTQAVARDLMAEAMLRLEKMGYRVVLSVHDEVLAEKEKGSVKEFIDWMTVLPTWAKGLPIKAEGWSGARYAK